MFSVSPKDAERFATKVEKTNSDLDCWEWKASRDKDGYGWFSIKSKSVKAHRIAYLINCGPIPDGLHILHSCDNPSCCNPHHLRAGTNADNIRDMMERNRQASGDKSSARLYPEKRPRGDAHHTRTNPDAIRRGTSHQNSKVTEAIVREIRHLYSQGVSCAEIARGLPISHSQVHRIATRKWWNHID